MKKLLILTMTMFLGCTPVEKVSQETKKFTIVKVKRPKHFYVDLQGENGQIHHQYVSKHCNNWCYIVIGSQVDLLVTTYKRDDKTWQEINAKSICPH